MEEYLQIAKKIIELRTTKNHPEIMADGLQACRDYFSGLSVIFKEYEHNGVKSLLILNQDTLTPDVLLLGHLDVADGADELFRFRVGGDFMYGRGTSDMKAFVASNLCVMRKVLTDGYRGSIGCLVVTDEEDGGFNGTRYVVEEIGLKPKIALVPDDGDKINTIVTASKHILSLEFTARGKSAHGNRPWDGVNAIDLLINTYQNLRKDFHFGQAKPTDNWVNTLNLGKINGGLAANEVPGSATMNVDIRFVSPTTKDEIIDLVKKSLLPSVDFKLLTEASPTIVDVENEHFLRYCSLIEKYANDKIAHKRSGGGTDARFFSPANTVIIVHQGDCGDAQGENEYVSLGGVEKLMAVQIDFIKSLS